MNVLEKYVVLITHVNGWTQRKSGRSHRGITVLLFIWRMLRLVCSRLPGWIVVFCRKSEFSSAIGRLLFQIPSWNPACPWWLWFLFFRRSPKAGRNPVSLQHILRGHPSPQWDLPSLFHLKLCCNQKLKEIWHRQGNSLMTSLKEFPNWPPPRKLSKTVKNEWTLHVVVESCLFFHGKKSGLGKSGSKNGFWNWVNRLLFRSWVDRSILELFLLCIRRNVYSKPHNRLLPCAHTLCTQTLAFSIPK